MTDKTKYLIIGIGKFAQGFLDKLREEGIKESNIFLVDESEETINKLAQEKYSNLIVFCHTAKNILLEVNKCI